ncbi:MAG: SDR family NAD(P)-dependent oxidoreductase, partial [Balneolales bacterium]
MADQKCALITGASSGIGKELTYLLARDGYSLILTALNKRKLEGFGMQVNEVYKVPVETIQADLSQETGARKLFDEVRKRDLSVDVLINNAGVGLYGDFRDVDMDEYFQIININI